MKDAYDLELKQQLARTSVEIRTVRKTCANLHGTACQLFPQFGNDSIFDHGKRLVGRDLMKMASQSASHLFFLKRQARVLNLLRAFAQMKPRCILEGSTATSLLHQQETGLLQAALNGDTGAFQLFLTWYNAGIPNEGSAGSTEMARQFSAKAYALWGAHYERWVTRLQNRADRAAAEEEAPASQTPASTNDEPMILTA